MGRRNPMAVFVVAPSIIMVSPKFFRAIERMKQIVTSKKVALKF